MSRLPWCTWLCCSLMASPYITWIKQPLSFSASNFLKAHYVERKACWASLDSWWTQQCYQIGIWVQILQAWFSTVFSICSLWEACTVVSLCSQALCQLHTFPLLRILIIETSLKPESHISTLAYTCVFLKAPLLPQHLTFEQFTWVMDTT